jgi:hypothetical protein
MSLFAQEAGERMLFSLYYNTSLFSEETIRWYTRYFKEVVSCAAAKPGTPLYGIGNLTEEEKNVRIAQLTNDLEYE